MIVKEIHKKPVNTIIKEKSESLIKEKRKADEKLVKGMFEFTDAQGGWLDFSTRFYPGEPIRTIHITHGEICDLPIGLVRHLNNTYKKIRQYDTSKPVDQHAGKGTPKIFQKISRCRFTPMDALAA